MKYNDGYKLNENSKALSCPVCQNEETQSDYEYCKICGAHIVNKCARREEQWSGEWQFVCNTIASGNARFCELCGHETTFFKNKFLKPWDNKEPQKLSIARPPDFLDDVPF